ncbi:ABC transporter permease [Gimesia panareensis]|uniref:Transport permease protein n=1 Tax=Gimesia panareensis TaxID=2527978 RepID=A0A517Q267_9PLAN|nr:ABC transporter permease [Gimesia panareensis]QDT25662.1 Daunorubicin/doxorubicin resistance ABC transporter permease protein DrrB [Gimesia panareensis]QDU48607.1 Daunorubicin/doxorubicin resistance ABC transporter permease protein DrrB [Gimesia panareensis]
MNQSTPTAHKPAFLLPILTLAHREVVRFVRQRTRVIGALIQPILFWILFGAGLRGSFQAPAWAPAGMTYQEYFFPGVAVMILMFTAIFSTISIIEDRKEGFLQGVLVAPVPRSSIVLGKLLGGTILAVLQAVLFIFLGPLLKLVGLAPDFETGVTLASLIPLILFLFLLGFSLTALGYLIAWPMESTQGFHAIMSVFLMPMWLLSGSFFPAGDSGWLLWIIRGNPLTYGVTGLRRILSSDVTLPTAPGNPSMMVCLTVTAVVCIIYVVLAIWMTGQRATRNAR